MQLRIHILGAECSICTLLFDRVQNIANDNNLDAVIEKITDTHRIIEYGICSIPALVINDKVVSKGMVPNKIQIIKLFNDFLPETEKLPVPQKKNISKNTLIAVFATIVIVSIILAFIFSKHNGVKDQEIVQSDKQLKKPFNIADSVNLLYNYSINSAPYKITFLEFGTTNCLECKKMKLVMDEVKQKHKASVNVVFYNVREKENKKISDYFKIQLIPIQVLLDKSGKEVFRHLGYYSTDSLSFQFKRILEKI